MILCLKCDELKGDLDFPPSANGKRYSPCRDCRNAGVRDWGRRNREKKRADHLAWIERNRDQWLSQQAEYRAKNRVRRNRVSAEWSSRNKERLKPIKKAWREANAGHLTHSKRLRMQKIRTATPKWANLALIELYYQLAQQIEIQTGLKVHVDHGIPLTHPDVCGLHTDQNLRLMWADDNLSKKNKLLEIPANSSPVKHAFTKRREVEALYPIKIETV